MQARKPNLILGIADNYAFYQISRFVLTLRKTEFDGRLCLFVGPGISAYAARRMRRMGVEVIRFERAFPFIRSPHPGNVGGLPSPIHIFNFRHFLYYDYLLKHGDTVGNVLLTDVADVVFQRDPFDFAEDGRLCVAMENRDIPIGRCCITPAWISAGFGEADLGRIADKELSCAGTTLGPVALVMDYLRLMLDKISSMQDAYASADQAAHNLLLHDGALEPVRKFYNFESPVLTVGTEPNYSVDGQGRLVNRDGSIINTIHQYNRHPELIALFDARARPGKWRRMLARTAFVRRHQLRHPSLLWDSIARNLLPNRDR